MSVMVNSCPLGKCWIAFSGNGVEVAVEGTSVGVSTGGRGVDVGDTPWVRGRLEGILVTDPGVPEVAQLASTKMITLNMSG
jgi:hypothetical protein